MVGRTKAMTRKKKLIYGGMALMIAMASWLGGYVFFVNSEDWYSAEQVIKADQGVRLNASKLIPNLLITVYFYMLENEYYS